MGVFDGIFGRSETGDGGREGRFAGDLRDFPLVRIDSPDVAVYDAVHVGSFFVPVDEALARGKGFVVLHDVRGLPTVDAARRREFLQMLDQRRADIEARAHAYAAIVHSPFERGLITAFSWFAQLTLPVRLFQRRDEAKAWLHERLSSAR